MEREMIDYPSWDLTISGPNLAAFTDSIKANYEKGVPEAKDRHGLGRPTGKHTCG